jgi:hypothetical protein
MDVGGQDRQLIGKELGLVLPGNWSRASRARSRALNPGSVPQSANPPPLRWGALHTPSASNMQRGRAPFSRALLLWMGAVGGVVAAGSATPPGTQIFLFGRHVNFQRGGERFPGKSRFRTSKATNPALATSSLWAMDGDSRPGNPAFFRRPLPIIGVRRGIMQCRAHDLPHRTAPLQWRSCLPERHWSGAVQ